jgi:hypothetical protein
MQTTDPDAQDGQMDLCLIQVPFHAGDDRHGASNGPGHLPLIRNQQVASTREKG